MTKNLPRFALIPLLLGAVAVGEDKLDKPKGLSVASPFAPVGGPTVAGATNNESLEFAGISTVGKRTDLIFYDKVTKKSQWLAKGEEKAGITLLNYDPQREQAVVKVNGIEKVLTLRKSHGANGAGRTVAVVPTGFNTPTATQIPLARGNAAAASSTTSMVDAVAGSTSATVAQPLPTLPPPGPATPQSQARQETEARMLVSDLLEIGMAQRKAYEEAQRKAAEGAPAATPPPASADSQTPPPVPLGR